MAKRELYPLFTWRGAIAGSDLPPSCRHVALTLSLHMNERGGSCMPGLQTLAEETGLHRSTVCRQLEQLEEQGWIRRERRGGRERGGFYRTTQYMACIPSAEQSHSATPSAEPAEAEPYGAEPEESPGSQGLLQGVTRTDKGQDEQSHSATPDGVRGRTMRHEQSHSATDGGGNCRTVRHEDVKPKTPPPPAREADPPPAAQLPPGFKPTAAMRAWAAEKHPDVDVDAETAAFADYHLARGSLRASWPAAWRGWIAKARRFGPQVPVGTAARASPRRATDPDHFPRDPNDEGEIITGRL